MTIKKNLQPVAPIQMIWCYHDYPPIRRMWLSTWSGDTFEIVNPTEFEQICRTCARFSILVKEADHDD